MVPTLAPGRSGEDATALAPAPTDPASAAARRRRLAILAADVVGYSRMMEEDDLRTALRVRELHRRVLRPAVRRHGGRVVSVAGDGAMAAFPGVADALRCALAVRGALGADGEAVAPPAGEWQRLRLRMGVGFGSVLLFGGEVYGQALNVAARLEGLAEPGGVWLSGAAFDQLAAAGDGGRPPVRLEPLGEMRLAKMAAPVRVYRVAAASP